MLYLFISLLTYIMIKEAWLTELKKSTKTLCNAFLFLNNPSEVFDFLRDLLTADELKEFQQRLDIAVRLYYKNSYVKIEEELATSSTTIARVSKYLKWPYEWYTKVIKRMYEDNK
jgi:TrpR-related protein YerC/YecD